MINELDFIRKEIPKKTDRRGFVLQKMYAFNCDKCESFLGYQVRAYKGKLCNCCAQSGKSLTSDHKTKISESHRVGEEFDVIGRETQQIDGRTHYKDICPSCNKDKGFVQASNIGKRCLSCGVKSTWVEGKRGLPRSESQRRIRKNIADSIRKRVLKRGANRKYGVFRLLGYSLKDLVAHLESKFSNGMSWNNYGHFSDGTMGWHIDHVIPDSFFEYSSTECNGFKESWALNNLQPMWGADNLKKGGINNKATSAQVKSLLDKTRS